MAALSMAVISAPLMPSPGLLLAGAGVWLPVAGAVGAAVAEADVDGDVPEGDDVLPCSSVSSFCSKGIRLLAEFPALVDPGAPPPSCCCSKLSSCWSREVSVLFIAVEVAGGA